MSCNSLSQQKGDPTNQPIRGIIGRSCKKPVRIVMNMEDWLKATNCFCISNNTHLWRQWPSLSIVSVRIKQTEVNGNQSALDVNHTTFKSSVIWLINAWLRPCCLNKTAPAVPVFSIYQHLLFNRLLDDSEHIVRARLLLFFTRMMFFTHINDKTKIETHRQRLPLSYSSSSLLFTHCFHSALPSDHSIPLYRQQGM